MQPLALAAVLAVLVPASCSRADPRCEAKPAGDHGPCEMVLGYVYSEAQHRCVAASGCECDDACRAKEIPFRSAQECTAVCGDPHDPQSR